MKKMKFFAAFALLAASSAVVMAQDFLTSASTDNYIVGYGAFSMGKINPYIFQGGEDLTDMYMSEIINDRYMEPKGVALGALYGYNIGGKLPLFVEAGVEFGFLRVNDDFQHDSEKYIEQEKVNYISIPVNLTYHFGFNDITVAPVLGVNCKFLTKGQYTNRVDGDMMMVYFDFFDDKVMENYAGGETANRFTFGANLGLNVSYKNFVLGYKFQPDFTKMFEAEQEGDELSAKFNTQIITLGYKF
ncbi:MAG: outer membrane beta-barrel protein [Bacteroidaceae bacterium]|nr:outer membrane beta-barrel protein [Bacteroidaceae bacterium]